MDGAEASREALLDGGRHAIHDLAEPARAVWGLAELLERRIGEEASPEVAEILAQLAVGGRRIHELLMGYSAFLAAERIELRIVETDPAQAVRAAAEDLHLQIHQADAQLEIEDDLPAVRADPERLAQALGHVLENALKFRAEEPPRIVVRGRRVGEVVVLEIVDDGVGFPGSDPSWALRLFQSAHPRGEYAGVGVGLSICTRLIERHDGTVSIACCEDRPGTIVSLTLPAA